jgi:hypothetical protein
MAVLQYIYIPKCNDYRNRNIVYNNYFQYYIDNCKLKKTRIRLVACSVKGRWIWRKKHFIYILYFIMSMFIKCLLYFNIGNNCCTQYFYFYNHCAIALYLKFCCIFKSLQNMFAIEITLNLRNYNALAVT